MPLPPSERISRSLSHHPAQLCFRPPQRLAGTPGLEQRAGGTTGRDHHPHGFTVWLAGAGLKGGYVHGATDEPWFHALDPGHYVTDLHATVLHLLGLDSHRLEVPGRRRLLVDFGQPIREIMV